MPAREIRFEFRSSCFGSATYKIVRYGHPDHDKTIEIRSFIYPLIDPHTGRKNYNYTQEKYERMLVPIKNYITGFGSRPLPLEYVHAFRAWTKESYDQAVAKYADTTFPIDWAHECTVKGTAHLVRTDGGEAEDWDNATYEWVLIDL